MGQPSALATPTPGSLSTFRGNCEHVGLRGSEHLLGHAADEHFGKSASTMRRHHDQVRLLFTYCFQDFVWHWRSFVSRDRSLAALLSRYSSQAGLS